MGFFGELFGELAKGAFDAMKQVAECPGWEALMCKDTCLAL